MNELGGIFRAFLASAFGGLVAKGFLTVDQVDQLINLLLGIGGIIGVAVWSYTTNTLKAALKRVADSPEVAKVEVVEADLANEIPSPKVVEEPIR